MSKAKITDKEYRRFEEIFYRVWHYYTFGHDKHVKLTSKDLERVTNTLQELKQTRQREHDIVVRHYIHKVYYTTIAREQGYLGLYQKAGQEWCLLFLTAIR